MHQVGGQAKNMHLMHKNKRLLLQKPLQQSSRAAIQPGFLPYRSGEKNPASTKESEVRLLSTWWERNPGLCCAANNHNLTETAEMKPGQKPSTCSQGPSWGGTECEGAEKLDSVILVIGFLFILSC